MISKHLIKIINNATIKALNKLELKEFEYLITDNAIDFDNYSYFFFKTLSKKLSKDKVIEITKEIGEEIYFFIKRFYKLESGNPEKIRKLKESLSLVLEYFVTNGYVNGAEISWDKFKDKDWCENKKSIFELIMQDPIILKSAKRLFAEEGFAQHYISRTIEAALLDFKINGSETKDFDPRKFKKERVIETWEIKQE